MRYVFAALALLLTTNTQLALAGEVANATVVELAIFREYGNFVFVRTDVTPTSKPTCATNGAWHFTLSLSAVAGKETYAMLLAAKTSGKRVHISGSNQCLEFGQIESIRGLNILD